MALVIIWTGSKPAMVLGGVGFVGNISTERKGIPSLRIRIVECPSLNLALFPGTYSGSSNSTILFTSSFP